MSFLTKRPFADSKGQKAVKTNHNSSNNSRLQRQEQNDSFSNSTTSDIFNNVSIDREQPRFGSPIISRRQSFRSSIQSPLGNLSKASSSSNKLSRRASFTYGLSSGLSSISGSPMSPLSRPSLPRVQRMAERDMDSSYLLSPTRSTMSPNKYPIHQSKYGSAGILPSVKLNKPERQILTDLNRSSPIRAVTVKVAPPDVLKPPTPMVLPLEDKIEHGKQASDSGSDAVLTALREKRKRPQVEESTNTPSEQLNKRRRHVSKTSRDTNLQSEPEPKDSSKIQDSNKRIATKRPVSNGESIEHKGTQSKRTKVHCTVNALEASYASSKGFLERQQSNKGSESEEHSREVMSRRVTRSKSRERTLPRQGDVRSNALSLDRDQNIEVKRATPRFILDDDVTMTSNVSTPVKNGPDTPLIDDNLTESELRKELGKKKPQVFTLKKGATKLRSTPIYSGSPSSLENIPTLRYSHTVEDYEKDRQEDINRIQQMLDDVDEAHKAKLDKAKEKSQDKSSSSTSSTLTLTSTTTTTTTNSLKLTTTSLVTSSAQPNLASGAETSTTTSTKSLTLGTTISIGNNSLNKLGASSTNSTVTPTVSIPSVFTNKDPPPYSAALTSTSSITPSTESSGSLKNTQPTPATTQPTTASVLSILGKHTPTSIPGSQVKTQEKDTPQFKPAFQLSGGNTGLPTSAQQTTATTVPKTIGGFSFPATTPAKQGLNLQSTTASVPTTSSVQGNTGNFAFGANSSSSTPNKASFTINKPTENKPVQDKSFTFGGNQTKSSQESITFGQTAMSNSQQANPLSKPTSQPFSFGSTENTKTLASGQGATANISSPFGNTTVSSNTPAKFGQNSSNLSLTSGPSTTFPFGQTSNNTGVGQNTNTGAKIGFGNNTSANKQGGFGSITTTSTQGIFGQNTSSTQSNPTNNVQGIFGQSTSNAQSTPSNSAQGIFGQNTSNTQSKPSNNAPGIFGQNTSITKSNPSSSVPSIFGQNTTSIFGQGTQNQSSNTPFGKTDSTKTTTAPIFGQSTLNTKMSTSQTPNQTESSNVFQFGQSQQKSELPKTSSIFSFGQSGNTTSKTPSSGGMFGATSSTQSGNIFGATQTPQKPVSGALNTGSTGGFGQSGTSSLGAGGTFGNTTSTQNQQNKGFDFSASTGGAKPAFSFGNNQPQSQPPSQGFSFTSGQGGFGSSQPTPAFGTPGASAPGNFGTPGASAPGNFGTPSQAPSTAMFSVGSGSTAAKPRSRSRRPPRR